MVQNVFRYESSDQRANIDFSCDGQLLRCASGRVLGFMNGKQEEILHVYLKRYDVKRPNLFDMAQTLSQSHDKIYSCG